MPVTPREIEDLFEDAALTPRRLPNPPGSGAKGCGQSWPGYVHDFRRPFMDHAATNWAIQQRGLTPATKMVLWFLRDRHNPDFGFFPTQARRAEDGEMSISALNEHLATLENLRLLNTTPTDASSCHHRWRRTGTSIFDHFFWQVALEAG